MLAQSAFNFLRFQRNRETTRFLQEQPIRRNPTRGARAGKFATTHDYIDRLAGFDERLPRQQIITSRRCNLPVARPVADRDHTQIAPALGSFGNINIL